MEYWKVNKNKFSTKFSYIYTITLLWFKAVLISGLLYNTLVVSTQHSQNNRNDQIRQFKMKTSPGDPMDC